MRVCAQGELNCQKCRVVPLIVQDVRATPEIVRQVLIILVGSGM